MFNQKIGIGVALLGAFALGASIVAYSSAKQDNSPGEEAPVSKAPEGAMTSSFSKLEEQDIRAVVYDYLMENPEVIIEAVNAYSARERERAIAQSKDTARARLTALLDPSTSYVAGKNTSKAKVAVVEMFDYHCSFCKRSLPLIQELAEDDADVKVVFRELPILREESDYAAEVSLAAREQGKFLPLHYEMMRASGVLTKDRIHKMADSLGINVDKLKQEIKSDKVRSAIVENHTIAAEMGVDGTPAFIIAAVDGSYVDVVNGFRPQEIVQKIEEAKAAAK